VMWFFCGGRGTQTTGGDVDKVWPMPHFHSTRSEGAHSITREGEDAVGMLCLIHSKIGQASTRKITLDDIFPSRPEYKNDESAHRPVGSPEGLQYRSVPFADSGPLPVSIHSSQAQWGESVLLVRLIP